MTRDEQRTKCFDAMEAAYETSRSSAPGAHRRSLAAAFDSLHGLAHVVPPEVTKEMNIAVIGYGRQGCGTVFRIMAAAGDLTNPPEEKP